MSLRPLIGVGWLLLVLVPAVAACCLLAGLGQRRRPATQRRRWLVRAGMLVTVGLIGLGPSVEHQTDEQVGVAVEMFFVVDRTGSMAAEDWADGQTRLDGVREDLPALVGALPGARYSIIGWSSEATRQLPLTTDARAVGAWAQTVRQEITAYSTGSLLDRPLEVLRTALQGAAERNPSHVRLVYFLSDGEQTTAGTPASYAGLADLVDGGAVLGYGTEEGGRMRSYDGSLDPDPDAPYILDTATTGGADDGAPEAISVIDEDNLRAVADQLGVPYVHRSADEGVAELLEGVDAEQIAADGRRTGTAWRLAVWPFALLLVGLLGLEAWWTAGSWTPARRTRPAQR